MTTPKTWHEFLPQAAQIVAAYRAQAPEGFDPQNTWIAVAGVAGGVLGGVGQYFAAKESAKGQLKATKKNVEAQERINKAQIDYQLSLLGEGGAPVNLPRYTDNYEAKVLFPEAQRIYDETGRLVASPSEYAAILNRSRPTLALSEEQIARLFSGDLTREQLSYLEPVAQARLAVAAAEEQAITDAVAEERNRIAALRAKQGFVGGGTMANNQLLSATLRARTGAAKTRTLAELQNRLDRLATQTAGVERATNAAVAGVPYQQTQRALEVERLPTQYVGEQFAARLSPFRFFQVPTKPNALAIQAPTFQAVPSTGQIAATALGQLGTTAGNFFANRAVANQLNQQAQLASNPAYLGTVNGAQMFNVPVSTLPAQQSVTVPGDYIGDVNVTTLGAV